MAKIVLAGAADCPYYAKVELLADDLARNLDDFKLNKIVIQPDKWEEWLSKTCDEKGWKHDRSPIVWRELVDRGGKGLLIGGANELQEYAHEYYGVKSGVATSELLEIAAENLQTKINTEEEERNLRENVNPVHVCITNASSGMCYNIINVVSRGDIFGATAISLQLYDSDDEAVQSELQGVLMEAVDLAQGHLYDVKVTSDLREAFANCSVLLLFDEIVREKEETDAEWLTRNRDLFASYADIIAEVARPDIKVIVAGSGPVNFNAYVMTRDVPIARRHNVVALPGLIESQAKGILGTRLKVNSACVADVIVWGNISGSHFVDTSVARVHSYDGAIWGPPSFSLPVPETLHDNVWLERDFAVELKERQNATEALLAHRATSALASTAARTLGYWWNGSPHKQMFSLAVPSEGWYGVPEGLVFSFPVTFNPQGYWTVCQDIELNDTRKEQIAKIVQELHDEIVLVYGLPIVEEETVVVNTEEEPVAEEKTDEEVEIQPEKTDDEKPVIDDEDNAAELKNVAEDVPQSTEDAPPTAVVPPSVDQVLTEERVQENSVKNEDGNLQD